MAVFLLNNCKFQGCKLSFTTLADLIQHIEDTHIDNIEPKASEILEDGKVISCVPLSHVLRYYTDAAKREHLELQKKQRIRAHSPAISLPESTPTESEVDDEEMKSDDDSNDSWTTQEDFPSDVILNMMGGRERDAEGDRPYCCPVPGCQKRYKNMNGIKYHATHAHKNEASKVKKSYRCFCGKSYRSAQGLRNHTSMQHPPTDASPGSSQQLSLSHHNLLSPLATPSPPAIFNTKDGSTTLEQISLHPPSLTLAGRLPTLTPSRSIPSKVAGQIKAVALAPSRGQGHPQTALALPIGTPVRFINQPASMVPVPVAVKSVKL